MSFQEKRSYVSLIGTLVIFAVYYTYVLQRYNSEHFTTLEELKFWGAVILILLPVLIVPKIIIHILFSIINKIVTNEDEPKFSDELDKRIEMRSTQNFYHVFIFGFFLSMGSLVINMPVKVMFNILLVSTIVAGSVMDISHIYFYRRGV